jgi:hypothetical protein
MTEVSGPSYMGGFTFEFVQHLDVANCDSCGSKHLNKFTAETAIHFPGLAGLNKPIVWAHPQVLVCLDCGTSRFLVPKDGLNVLRDGQPNNGLIELRCDPW